MTSIPNHGSGSQFSLRQQDADPILLHDYANPSSPGHRHPSLRVGASATASSHAAATTSWLYSRFVGSVQYPRDATSSYLISAKQLLAVRIVGAIFLSVTVIVSLVLDIVSATSFVNGIKHFFYFTNLNLYGLIAYLVFTLHITRRTFHNGVDSNLVISQPAAIIHSIMYSLNCTFHPIVVAVFWTFLSDLFFNNPVAIGRFLSVSSHGVTLFFIVCEVVFGAMQMNIWAIVPVIVILILYAAWALIYYAMSAVFVYSFLDFHEPQASYMYPGVAIASAVSFFIMFGLNKLRTRLFASHSLHSPPSSMELSKPDDA